MSAPTGPATSPDLARLVRTLLIDPGQLMDDVRALAALGSSDLGFRVTGTPQDRAAAEHVTSRMREIGLADVAVEDVAVDAWHFRGASAAVAGGPVCRAASFGGVPGTGPDGVVGPLVDVGDGARTVLDGLGGAGLAGAVALVDWARGHVEPVAVGLELARRGVVAMVLSCPPGGPYYQAEGAIGSFDSHWHPDAPPVVTVSGRDAAALREAARTAAGAPRPRATVVLEADLVPGAPGHNTVGWLRGSGAGEGPIVVGAHHDGWFAGAFDNASGVAAMLAVAGALVAAGARPRHDVVFTSRTAEEYGLAHHPFDWCTGAWEQVSRTHPGWGAEAAFHLCVEASGHPDLRLALECPPELLAWGERAGSVGQREGWLPTGWRTSAPVAGTEQWPYLVAGVPGVAAYTWDDSFATTRYHTQLDVPEVLDPDLLASQARFYAWLLLDADARSPEDLLDHGARARRVQTAVAGLGARADALAAAAGRHAGASGRSAFTAVGRGLLALDAHGATGLRHEQAAADAAALERAVAALDAGDPAGAADALEGVGHHRLHGHLSREAFETYVGRFAPAALEGSWAGASHLTASPRLWEEIASLRGEAGARESGPWLGENLLAALAASREELDARLAAMAECLGRSDATGG